MGFRAAQATFDPGSTGDMRAALRAERDVDA
jgi:hypothetical protein